MTNIQAQTRDLGFAIRDFIEGGDFFVLEDGDASGELWAKARRDVAVVDVTDPNNILIVLDNGQRFRCRISAEG